MRGVAKGETTAQRIKVCDQLLRRYEGDPSIYPSTIESLLAQRAKLAKQLEQEKERNG